MAHSPRSRHRLRKAAAAIAGLGLAVGIAACSAGTSENSAGSGGNGQSGASSRYLNFFPCCAWGTTWSNNPYNANGLSIQNDFITLRLAIPKAPSLTDYIPQLADTWTIDGDKLGVHLREDAKWQDGKPVTSKDLYDTVILDGTRGDGFWNDISDVEITDDHTVTFTLNKGQPMALAQNDILGNLMVYPSSVYGQFATDDLAEDVKTYFGQVQKNPDQAAKSDEFKTMGDTFKKLAALKVDKLIGDGPFQLDNITTKEAKLDKWDGFWGADKIKMAGIDWSNGANQAIYPQLLSGNVDLSNVYVPPPILKQWKGMPDAHLAQPLGNGFVVGFNSHHYPLNLKEVRQALAYVMPRQQMTEAAYGTTPAGGGTWKETNTGLPPSLEDLYLSDDQLSRLNTYPVDKDKASELLKSKGFTQKDGQWMLPDGKPFKLTWTVNADYSDVVTSFNSAAKALTAFGIKSDLNATSGAQQDADQHNGDFEVGMYTPFFTPKPLAMFSSMMGSGNNYSDSGNYAGKRGIGFGPEMDVPGLGKVDVPATLDRQAASTGPGETMKKYSWDWAQLVNDQVPYIWYATKVNQLSFSSKNFDNWPSTGDNGTGELWDIVGTYGFAGISWSIQQGYITPKN